MRFWWIALIFAVGCGSEQTPDPVADMANDIRDTSDTGTPDVADDISIDADISDVDPPFEIVSALFELDNVAAVVEIDERDGFKRLLVRFEQPLDHVGLDGRTFIQDALLYHRDPSRPMVLVTTGYELGAIADYDDFYVEPTAMLDANQMFMGHRFFGGALPAPNYQDWTTLTVAQAAADGHAIVSSLKEIYDVPWIATGWSKGGLTPMLHEYFYPEDLDLVIPMVAPLTFGKRDPRYPAFLDTIGVEPCRLEVDQAMIDALGRVEEFVDFFDPAPEFREANRRFVKENLVSMPWNFWQGLGIDACDQIPDATTASIETLVNFFFYQILPRPIGPDEWGVVYQYQAATEIGNAEQLPTGLFARLEMLGLITADDRIYFETSPDERADIDWAWEMDLTFDPQPMLDLDAWLKTTATDMIAVYGEYDPWTAGIITLDENNNSRVFVAPQTSHATMLEDLEPDALEYVERRIQAYNPAPVGAVFIPRVKMDRQKLRELLRKRLL